MRKAPKILLCIALFFVHFAISSFKMAVGQGLEVYILFGYDAVTEVSICQGSILPLTVEVYGGSETGRTYVWTHDVPVGQYNDNEDMFSIKSSASAGTYNLTVNVTDDGGFSGSASVVVTINASPSPVISANDATTFCEGGNVELVENASSGTVTYQWQKNFANITGATSRNYVATTSGRYRIKVTGGNECYKVSSNIEVTVNSLPSVSASSNTPICDGENLNLTSSPGGATAYSWTSNAVSAFLSSDQNPTIAPATNNNSGKYTVNVTDGNGCSNTASTDVVVNAALDAGKIGTAQTICYSTAPNALTSIAAASGGRGEFTYAWKQKVGEGTWTDISGATDLTYAPAVLTQTTSYKRIATNTCGSAETAPITITVREELNAGSISGDQSICYNIVPATFTSTAEASGGDAAAWTYLWEIKVGDGAWNAITGANSATYTANALTQTTKFRRAATNATCGATVYSNEITVTVHLDFNPGVVAESQSVCYGGNPEAFTATAATGGTGTTTYRWESTPTGGSSWTAVASTETYDVPAGITASTDYRRVASNTCGIKESNVITVTVYSEMDAGAISYTSGDVCYLGTPGEIQSTQGASGGFGAWTYQWYYQTNCTGTWNTISGATSTLYAPPANQTETRCYKRAATNETCGSVETAPITITVRAELKGGTIGSDQSVCYGDVPAAFTNDGSPTGGKENYTYVWQLSTGGAWSNIAGATSSTYASTAGIQQTTSYRRQVTDNNCGTAYSNEITVTVADEVLGGTITAPAAVCYNGDPDALINTTSPSGGTGTWTYSWEYKVGAGSWNVIAGSNVIAYNPDAGQTETRTYRRKSTNECSTAYSNEVELTVWDNVASGSIKDDQSICYNGDPAEITSATLPTGGNTTTAWTYKWEYQSNCTGTWVEIAGATGESYDPPVGLTENRCYRRVEIDECSTIYSNTVTISVGASLVPGAINGTQSICYGQSATTILNNVTAATGDGTLNYFWEKKTTGSWATITGATGISYMPTGTMTETTIFRRGVKDNCNTGYSNEITVTVNPLPTVTLANFDDVCIDAAEVTLAGGSPAGGTYSGTGVTAGKFNPATAGEGTHTITYTYNDGCEASATSTITVQPLPTAYSVTGGGSYCESNPTLEVGIDGSQTGVAYTLYKDGVATTAVVNGTGTAISFGIQMAGTYTVKSGNTATGCTQIMSGNAVLAAVPEISGNTISADQTVCEGSVPATITGSTPTGGNGTYTYQWYVSNDGVTYSIIAGAILADYTPNAETSSKWYTRYVYSTTCESQSSAVKITVLEPVSCNTISSNQTICYNTVPAALTGATPCNGDGTYTYQWQISSTGLDASFTNIAGATEASYQPDVLTANTWYRRAVASGPCAANYSASVKIAVNEEFSIQSITPINPTCNGVANGEATVTVSGGEPTITYSWDTNPVQTSATATGLSANVTYTVVATDGIGCTATDNIILTEPDAISLAEAITVTAVTSCHGDAAGTVQALAQGGTPNYIYTLQGPSGTLVLTPIHPAKAEFTGLLAGTYSLSITDANGCTPYVENSIVITEPDELVITGVTTTPISCNGETDGTITIVATGGTAPYEYSVDGGFTYATTDVFNVGEGYYDVKVKDASGCEAVWAAQVELVEPTQILFSYQISPITSCNGDNTGVITISGVSGGSGEGYQFSISMPEVWGNDSIFENLPGGTENKYYIKVKDSHGCISAANNGNPINIDQPLPIKFSTTLINVTRCWYNVNGQIRIFGVSGGTGTKKYSIDGVTYGTSPNFTVGIGSYTVYVQDAKGCIASEVVEITGPNVIVINSITPTDVTCFGSIDGRVDFNVTGGTGTLEYSIDGITYQSANSYFGNLASGTYVLYIRDANGCVLEQEFKINSPEALYFTNFLVENITCFGLTDGKITLQAKGGKGSGYLYSINGGATYLDNNGDFTGLSAGNYTPAVTDGTCSVLGDVLAVVEPAEIAITSQTSTDITCNNANDGTITVTATGGTGDLIFNLYLNSVFESSNTTGEFTGLAGGTYKVEVTDANGCGPKTTADLVVVNPELVTFTYTTTDLSCYGYDDGSITITPTGGSGVYEYSINGSAFTAIPAKIENLAGGTYTIVVRDDKLCESAPQDVVITEPEAIKIKPIATPITCNGLSNGQIVTTAEGGSGTYQFRINGSTWQASGIFTDLGRGSYVVEANDGSCIIDSTVTIVEPDNIEIVDIIPTDIICGNDNNGTIKASAKGGTGTLTYSLLDNTNTVIATNTNGLFEGLSGGTYTIQITDDNSCGPISTPIIIDEPTAITIANVVETNISPCAGDANGAITITANGGTAPLKYSIDGGATYQDNGSFIGLAKGTYPIIVEDANGCNQSSVANITEPAAIVFDNLTVVQESAPNANDGQIVLLASGGSAPLTYNLYDKNSGTLLVSQDNGVFDNLGTGEYYVEVVDANGCSKQTEVIVISATIIEITHTNITCYGANNGTVNVTILGGFPPYAVTCGSAITGAIIPLNALDASNTSFEATGLSADTLLITVTDSKGTSFPTRQVEILEPDTMVVNLASTGNPLCFGETNGSVVFGITGGTPDYTVSWADTSAVTSTVTGLVAGNYSFVITDANGCTSDTIKTSLVNPDSIEVSIQIVQETGYGAGNGIVQVTANGGTGSYTYVLQPTGTTSDVPLFNSLVTGKYSVQVIDANGCMAQSDEFVIRGTDIVIDTVINAICYGDTNGAFEFTINHGFHPFNVSYHNANDTIPLASTDAEGRHFAVNTLVAGEYNILIVDSLGNTIQGIVEITQPDSMVATIASIKNVLCAGDLTGIVEFAISGGTPNYQIQWNGNTTNELQVDSLAAGPYTFSITDVNGCFCKPIDTVITGPQPISLIDTVLVNPTCHGEAIGSIQLTPAGGTGSYTYQLGTNAVVTSNVFENLSAGSYTVAVVDSLGCSSTFNFKLVDTTKITIDATVFSETMTCPYDTLGYINLNVTGGYGNYQYIWPSLGESTDSVGGLHPGEYIIIVVDAANCAVSDTFTISGPQMFEFDKSVISMASCRQSNAEYDGAMGVSGSGGNSGAITFSLITPQNDTIRAGAPNFTHLPAGDYVIIAEDSKGCKYEMLDTIPINPLYNFEVEVPDTVVCFANNVVLSGHMLYDTTFDNTIGVTYTWWNEGNETSTPNFVGENYNVYLPEAKTYRFKLRVAFSGAPGCYEEDWAEVNVYPEIGVHVPIYVSSVQNDTIISVLFDNEYNIDVNTMNVDYSTKFQWYPSEMFTDSASWNTSILLTKEKYNQIHTLYPNRFVDLKDPQTKKMTNFIVADVIATTDVGCVDSLRLYTKIVKKLYLASVFSPNGDGRNDIWQIPKDYLFPDLEVEIFNRWGSLVWSAKGDKAAHGWDGKTNSGKALPIGTYWYVIKFNLEKGDAWKPETGSVTIVK